MTSIQRLLSGRQSPEAAAAERDAPARVVGVDEEVADEVFSALSSETARSILAALHEQPRTASEVAEAVDTSLQNASYHLDALRESDLVAVVDTWYSDQGAEMDVYAPENDALVVLASPEPERSSLREGIERLLGAVAVLGVLSLLVDRIAEALLAPPEPAGAMSAADAEPAAPSLPAGELFFLGAVAALALVAAWRWYRGPA